jgi:4-hydroxymandelate oxidase
VRRAEAAGYGAIVLTIDAAIKLAGMALPAGVAAANLAGQAPVRQQARLGGAAVFGTPLADAAPRWEDLAWLRAQNAPAAAGEGHGAGRGRAARWIWGWMG